MSRAPLLAPLLAPLCLLAGCAAPTLTPLLHPELEPVQRRAVRMAEEGCANRNPAARENRGYGPAFIVPMH